MLTFFKLLVATGVAFASVSPLLCADDECVRSSQTPAIDRQIGILSLIVR